MTETMKPGLVVMLPYLASFAPALAETFDIIERGDDAGIARNADRVIGIFCSGSQMEEVSAAFMDRLPGLRMIVNLGAGLSRIDLDAAKARGITVTNGANAHSSEVADHAVTLTLAARQRLMEHDRQVRAGEWLPNTFPVLRRSLSTERVGIVGMGSIGRLVASKIQTICPEIRWWAPRPQDLNWPRMDSLIDLARWCSIMILAARGDGANAKMITADVIDAIGPDGLFVNVARGFLVDEDSLIAALRSGRLGQAALDVFQDEPTDPAHWADVPNTLFTPHCGGSTDKALNALRDLVVHNLRSLVTGESPRNIVV